MTADAQNSTIDGLQAGAACLLTAVKRGLVHGNSWLLHMIACCRQGDAATTSLCAGVMMHPGFLGMDAVAHVACRGHSVQ